MVCPSVAVSLAFSDYSSHGAGGAMYVSSHSTLRLSNVVFENNAGSDKSAGALYLAAATTTTITNCNFTSNRVDVLDYMNTGADPRRGGAIFIYTGEAESGDRMPPVVTITASSFDGNAADDGGSAIYIGTEAGDEGTDLARNFDYGASVTIADTVFTGCSCRGRVAEMDTGLIGTKYGLGGAIRTDDVNVVLTLQRCRFTGCTAQLDGGAVSMLGTALTVEDGVFEGCTSTTGGAISSQIYGTQGNVSVSNTTFSGCKAASNGGLGGAVSVQRVDSGVTLSVQDCTFTQCSAGQGGAISLLPAGSGFDLDAPDDSAVLIADSTFDGNAGTNLGGAVFVQAVNASILRASFVANRAAGGGSVAVVGMSTGHVTFEGGMYQNNTALNGGGAVFLSGNASSVEFKAPTVTFEANSAQHAGAVLSTMPLQTGLAASDTAFSGNAATLCFQNGYGSSPAWLDQGRSCADVDDIPGYAATTDANAYITADLPLFICCGIGYYSPDGQSCKLCTEGGGQGLDCTQSGTTTATLSLQQGYWRGDDSQDVIHECLLAEACAGGRLEVAAFDADGYCAEGYRGPYCAVCDAGYASAGAYKCHNCTPGNKAAAWAGVVVMLLVLVAAAVYVLPLLDVNGQEGVLAPTWRSKVNFNGNYLRIPIIVVQLVAGFMSITGLQLAAPFEAFIRRLAVIPDFTFIFGCIFHANFYQKLLVVTLAPLLPVALLGCSWLWSLSRRQRRRPRKSDSDSDSEAAHARALRKHWTALLAFTFLVYGTTSSYIFQTFACASVEELDESYLRADYSIRCYDRRYWPYFAYAMAMILVYPVGVPALNAVLLYRKRRLNKEAELQAAFARANAAAARRAPAAKMPSQTSQVALPSSHATVSQLELERSNGGSEREQEYSGLVGASSFIWAPYTNAAEWWELVECARRVLLTGILVFIAPGTPGQAAVSMLMAFVALLAFMAVRPHRDHAMHQQYLLGALIVYFASTNALLLDLNISQSAQSQTVVGILLVVLSVVLIVAAAVQTVSGAVDFTKVLKVRRPTATKEDALPRRSSSQRAEA
ncbi:hypothetical protein JKP88DRAFT_284355 [Tribonema minus]|uniref:Uncharacterized protein n=1 Tax=Tribonema minus TaxID=303371 RepID=A0A835ZGE0_9STRA|nr:hypothetical protein JKP88DRAFT_284355 [Tribonema minus]